MFDQGWVDMLQVGRHSSLLGSTLLLGVLLGVFARSTMGEIASPLGEVMGCCEPQPKIKVHFSMLLDSFLELL